MTAPEGRRAPGPARDWKEAGFFLVDRSGAVFPASALASVLSGRENIAPDPTLSLPALLGLHAEQDAYFRNRLQLAWKKHGRMRWEKLTHLAPIHELRGTRGEGEEPERIAYRKVEDAEGRLSAIAVFAIDMTPGRSLARQLEEERLRHKLEIRDFLALAANPPEAIGGFLEEAGSRLEAARKEWLARAPEIRGEGPGQRLLRELHTLKGNAGAFGFEGLSASAQESEDLLEALQPSLPVAESDRLRARLAATLAGLLGQLEEIRRAVKLVSGAGQEAMVRILRWKLERLVKMAAGMDAKHLDPQARALMELSRHLPFLSPAYLARKYRSLVERLALKLGKEVRFRVTSNTGDIHPESFSRVDEAMVHILRNMVDHGIELPAEREAAGKAQAVIELAYEAGEKEVVLRIRDDGRGMDPDGLARRAVTMGLLSEDEAAALAEGDRLNLVFREGFTTRDRADLVSGRGVGLALAANCVAAQGGNLLVSSQAGLGTCFILSLPSLD